MAKKKAPDWIKVEDVTRQLPVELSEQERLELRTRENEQGEEVLLLEREHEHIRTEEKEAARARREVIKDARAAWSKTIDERRSGTALREFKCQVRAMLATQTIDTVRIKDGETVDSRPMTEDERGRYLQQGLLDDAPTVRAGLVTDADAVVEEPEASADDTLPDDECDAIRVPHGWPRAWRDRRWRVDDAALPLTGPDVAQVYYSLSASGSTLDELCADGGPSAYLGRKHIVRALALLNGRALAVVDEGRWWAKVEAPAAPTEPGQTDTLPEAASPARPKRRRAKDTGEALLNAALGQSEAMEAVA